MRAFCEYVKGPVARSANCNVSELSVPKGGLMHLSGSSNVCHQARASSHVACMALLGVSFIEGNPQRCGHPGQQHGLRMPPRSLSMPTSMRRFLVSSFLADVTQQIHSFRASGVISTQRLFAVALDSMASRKSAGSLCTVPPSIF